MDKSVAQILVRSLIGRTTATNGIGHSLGDGRISVEELQALKFLAGIYPDSQAEESEPKQSAAVVSLNRIKLDLTSIKQEPNYDGHVCLDFGTAYSKAAYWSLDADSPKALDLGAFDGRSDAFPIQSCAYVTGGVVLFGGVARDVHEAENNDARELFSSPKQYLTHGHEDLNCAAKNSIDPTNTFTTGELLTLYLAFLTKATCDRLEGMGLDRYSARRHAMPGWNDAQLETPSDAGPASMLRTKFLEAQILADSISKEDWVEGLSTGTARDALDQLASLGAARLLSSSMQSEPVLEAIAASSGVHERFLNSRPQLLVVDVGAGTTDIGVFKIATPMNRPQLAFPYRNGMAALRRAGDNVDEILVMRASERLGLSNGSQLAGIVQRKLRQRIRNWKSELFDNGSVIIEVEDYDPVAIELDDLMATEPIRKFAAAFRGKVIETLNRAGIGSENFVKTNDQNIVVFTGGGSRLPFLTRVFDEPLELEAGSVMFSRSDPEPEWVSEMGANFKQVFPQLAVATGGAASDLPDRKSQVIDTRHMDSRRMTFFTG